MWASKSAQSPSSWATANLTRSGMRTRLEDLTERFTIDPAETAAGLVEADLTFGFLKGDVHRYGAEGDGVANDRTPILRAFNVALQAGGGEVIFASGNDYFVGNSGSAENIFTVTSLANTVVRGNGARITMNTTGNYQPVCFNLINPRNVSFEALNFYDAGADLSVDWRGAWAIYLQASGAGATYGHVQVNNCHGESLVAFLRCGPAATTRITNIQVNNCSSKTVYYPLSFENNGDDVTVVNFRAWNPRRAYFPIGVQNHDIDIKVFIDSNAVPAASMFLMKSYASTYPLRGIRLRAKLYGDLTAYTGQYGVTLEHQPATADVSRIEDIDVELSMAGVTAGYLRPFHLSSYNNDTSLEETTTTANVWRHLRFGGDISKYLGHIAGSPANFAPIDLRVSPTTECDIELSPSLVASWPLSAYKNNFVLKLAPDRDARFYLGDLTAATVAIPLAGFDQCGFVVKVRVWAHDNSASISTQNCTYTERLITGYNAGAGNVAIQVDDVLVQSSQGTAATVTIAASGENLAVTFAGATYNGANARARVDTEFVSMMRAA